MKFFREVKRIVKQFISLPANIIGYFFSTFSYDAFLSKKKKISLGNIPFCKKIVIYVIFPINGLNDSHLNTINYFFKKKYSVLVISNRKLYQEDKKKIKTISWALIERENYGYDFGGWRDGIIFLKEQLKSIENLILINDSTWFPINKGNDFVDFIAESNLDFIGATSHYGLERFHLPRDKENLKSEIKFSHKKANFYYSSYVLSFSNRILNDDKFLKFWKRMRLSNKYNVIVRNGEIGISQWVFKNGGYTHGSLIDSSQISQVLNKFSKEKLFEISQNLIVDSYELKNFMNSFSSSIESFSKGELISYIMTIVSKQIIVFSLADFLVRELNFPFLKKRIFNLDEDCALKGKKIVESLTEEVKKNIFLEINRNSNLNKFLN